MLVDQTVTYMEMTSPDQLLAGRVPPAEVTLDSVDATALALIRATHDQIAAPHHWSSLEWSEQQWSDLLARPECGPGSLASAQTSSAWCSCKYIPRVMSFAKPAHAMNGAALWTGRGIRWTTTPAASTGALDSSADELAH